MDAGEGLIYRGQPPATAARQQHQIRIGDLPVAGDAGDRQVQVRDGVGPEFVSGALRDRLQRYSAPCVIGLERFQGYRIRNRALPYTTRTTHSPSLPLVRSRAIWGLRSLSPKFQGTRAAVNSYIIKCAGTPV